MPITPDTDTPTPPLPLPPGAQAPVQRPPRLPSLRVSAALAAGMLAIGVAAGAAIGPAPETSLAGERIPLVLHSIAALAGAGASARSAQSSPSSVQPPAITPQVTPAAASVRTASGVSPRARTPASKARTRAISPAPSPTPAPSTTKAPSTSTGTGERQAALAPVTSVWLITLAGSTFSQALSQTAAAPYIDSQLIPGATLLSGWSSLDAASFASAAGLLAGEAPQTLDSIVQPPCPEGAAGSACAPETAGALTAADEFLKATVPTITSSAAYHAHGLIVITFGTVGNATSSSLPAGASTATLSTEPPVGALLLSPFARVGTRPKTAFDPASPKQSLSGLLH